MLYCCFITADNEKNTFGSLQTKVKDYALVLMDLRYTSSCILCLITIATLCMHLSVSISCDRSTQTL